MSSLERNFLNVSFVGQLLHRKGILRIIKSDILGNQHQDDELLLGSQLENIIIILERKHSAGMSRGMRFPTMWYFDKCRQACAVPFYALKLQMMCSQQLKSQRIFK